MLRIIAIIVIITLLPLQALAGIGLELEPVEKEHLIRKQPVIKREQPDTTLTEKLKETPPAPTTEAKSGTNWWLWGGLGLAAVVGGVVALSGSSKKSSDASTPPSTVAVSW
jgi:hypothetical protein